MFWTKNITSTTTTSELKEIVWREKKIINCSPKRQENWTKDRKVDRDTWSEVDFKKKKINKNKWRNSVSFH